MIYTKLTKLAMNIANEKHYKQKDISGYPYILHALLVADKMDDEISCAAALLHDVIEDTDTTYDDLRKLGIPEEVIVPLKLLTRDPKMAYNDYIRNLLDNPIALKVKKSDIAHNSDLNRLDKITKRDINRKARYDSALEIIKEYEKNK